MAFNVDEGAHPEAITPYRIHVSGRYLDLTRRKVELTRLPLNFILPAERSWEHGPPKNCIEPLIDHWLENYDWRAQEQVINSSLPQYRTTVKTPSQGQEASSFESLRVHFVHKRSSHMNAIPLLYCHGWPGSILEISKIINNLTDHKDSDAQAFHVVAPSMPGFGFSDSSAKEGMGFRAVADMYDTIMKRLGYEVYVAHGGEWGSNVCRMLAIHHRSSCVAIHVANGLRVKQPSWRYQPWLYLQYRIARLTQCRIPGLRFGYIPSDFETAYSDCESDGDLALSGFARLQASRPQTLAYGLCDSPVGLLSYIYSHLLNSCNEHDEHQWTSTDILNFFMMYWLPGPDAGLRWFRESRKEQHELGTAWSTTPLGVSTFRRVGLPVAWYAGVQPLRWVNRHPFSAKLVPWERPDILVTDLREFFGKVIAPNDARLRVTELQETFVDGCATKDGNVQGQ